MSRPSTSWDIIGEKDNDFSDRIRNMLDLESAGEESEETSVDDSDADPDFIISNEDGDETDSEPDEEDDEMFLERDNNEELPIENMVCEDEALPQIFFERMKKKEVGPPNIWNSAPPTANVRTPAHNIIRTGLPGLRGPARLLGNKPRREEVWKLFFNEDIISKIVINTNIKLNSVRQSVGGNKSNYRDTDTVEINALIGLLLVSSVLKSNHEQMYSSFAKDEFSRPIYRCTMSVKRYQILLECLRFDDSQTRRQRKETDKAAPISEIFHKFISNSQSVYCTYLSTCNH